MYINKYLHIILMSKIICFLYTDTNGLHDTNDDVSKKKYV